MKQIMLEQTGAKDLIPIFFGHELCEKNHKFGPYTRSYYLIHFCLNGSGELFDKFGRHTIRAGELFIIRPNEITTYVADEKDPWEYFWVSFHGDMAHLFNTERSTYPFPAEIGATVRGLVQNPTASPAVFIALLFHLVHHLFNEQTEPSDTAEKIRQYIRFNYMNDLTVRGISDYFGFERSYLFRIFKKSQGISVKEYIVKTRMEQAKLLLEKGCSVTSTANAVGYADPFNFSKAFKNYFGFAPKKIGQ